MRDRRQLRGFGIILATALVLAITVFVLYFPKPGNTTTVRMNGATIRATVADTDEEREQGLSGSEGLAADRGMLFVFPTDGYWSIWMKDMNYAIDILWLNDQKSIVHIEEFVTPDTYPQTFVPKVPSRYVLEVQSGIVSKNKLGVGDTLQFKLK